MGSNEAKNQSNRPDGSPAACSTSNIPVEKNNLNPKFWYSNAIFFVGTHIAAFVGVYNRPMWDVPTSTLLLAFLLWQASCFGVTIGYHRLYSHRTFRASTPVRVVLAALGSMAFQGSIKRFTDDPVHDPYAATRGLFFSHMGWIFFKPNYEKMGLIDKDDLENDPVARFQHKHYVPIALSMGFVLPTLLGLLWNDPLGAYVWAGLVARLAIWHCTFFVNSLAHWDGLQPYSDEDTSRGSLLLALLTCGEGNHNFHTFPQDYRSGPSPFTWDPSKWIIMILHYFNLASGLRRAREDDIRSAVAWMKLHGGNAHHSHPHISSDAYENSDSNDGCTVCTVSEESEWNGMESGGKIIEVWNDDNLKEYILAKPGRCVVVIDGYVVDVTTYMGEHPGGAVLLREYSERLNLDTEKERAVKDADAAFHGGMNNHSRAAKRCMLQMRIARIVR